MIFQKIIFVTYWEGGTVGVVTENVTALQHHALQSPDNDQQAPCLVKN